MIARSDYIPSSEEDHAEPPRKKIFRLVREEDETTELIITAREKVLKDRELMPAAVRLFCFLLDLCVRKSSYLLFGSVCISEHKLSEIFKVSERTIWNWLHARKAASRRHPAWVGLAVRDYVWVGKNYVSNMWARNVYHITDLSPKPPNLKRDDGGHYGNGKVRGSAPPVLGCRIPGQRFLPGLHVRSITLYGPDGNALPPSESAQVVDTPADTGKSFRVRPEKDFGRDPKKISGETRKEFRARPEEVFGPDPKKISGQTRKELPASPEIKCRLKEAEVEAQASLSRGAEPPPPKNGEWERQLRKLYPDELRGLKADLIAQQKQLEPGDVALADLSVRIMAIDRQLYGAPVAKRKVAPVKAAKPTAAPELTEDELLAGARYLVESNKAASLTAKQRWALQKVGELPA